MNGRPYLPPPLDPNGPTVRLLKWEPRRRGPLRGFACVIINEKHTVYGVAVLRDRAGRGCVVLPPKGTGKRRSAVDEWLERQPGQHFSDATIAALLSARPDALDDDVGRGAAS